MHVVQVKKKKERVCVCMYVCERRYLGGLRLISSTTMWKNASGPNGHTHAQSARECLHVCARVSLESPVERVALLPPAYVVVVVRYLLLCPFPLSSLMSSSSSLRSLLLRWPHLERANHVLLIAALENCPAGDNHVRACRDEVWCIGCGDAAVHFDMRELEATLRARISNVRHLAQCRFDIFRAAPSGRHEHDHDNVHDIEHGFHGRDARRRIEHETYMYRFMRYVYCHEGSDSERSAHECQWITTYRSELHSCMCFAIERRCVCGSLRVEVCGGLHDGGTQGWVSFGVHTPQKRWVCVRINSKAPCTCAHICI